MNMATEDPNETWEEFYKTNQSIPVHPSRITTENGRSGQPYCFCLNVIQSHMVHCIDYIQTIVPMYFVLLIEKEKLSAN